MSNDGSVLDTIHIVTATNNAYAEHLAVMINSLLENKVSKNPIKIYVIGSDISQKNKSILVRTVRKFKARIRFKQVDPKIYEEFMKVVSVGNAQKYLTKETYYRIAIPDLLRSRVHKAIYLDSDMIVKEDITKLWNMDIDQYFLGAVEDYWVKDSRNKSLSMPRKSKYFNAGVLVINLKKWREERVKNKIIEFIKKNSSKIKFYSQDPLNAIFHDKWLQIDPKWNFQTQYLSYSKLKNIKPAIIHYTGGNKPWKSKHPLKEEYLKYRKNVFN
ncbi:glycosyltransferase family 8 protein [Paenibacillus sp. GCM10027628]|uniref:glycosyltransferase family 8 protein n=1 Tax=Paenibacillus sp. GCM10027628 TaxID=3273413 RepID=UPI003633308A